MEPIASPTRSDLLQKINEKNIVSIPIIYCVKLQGNMRLFRWDCLSDFECSDGSKRYRRISLECFSAATYHSEVVAQALEEYAAAEDTIQNSALNFVHDTLRYALLEEVISL